MAGGVLGLILPSALSMPIVPRRMPSGGTGGRVCGGWHALLSAFTQAPAGDAPRTYLSPSVESLELGLSPPFRTGVDVPGYQGQIPPVEHLGRGVRPTIIRKTPGLVFGCWGNTTQSFGTHTASDAV